MSVAGVGRVRLRRDSFGPSALALSARKVPVATIVGLAVPSIAVGAVAAHLWPSSEATAGLIAIFLCIGFAYRGRRDVTRPEILLPVIWYAAVALAQLKLLHGYETPWSTVTLALVFAGPLFFASGAFVCSSGVGRPRTGLSLNLLEPLRLRACGLMLLGFAAIGLLLKARVAGGLALFAGNIDSLRSANGVKIHAWITVLTDCSYLSAWVWMLHFAVSRRRATRLADAAMVLLAFVGVASGASRNTILLAIIVPIVFAYLIGATRRLKGKMGFGAVAGGVMLLLIVSGLFYVRTAQHEGSAFESYFYKEIVPTTSGPVRPLLPVYISLATPLDTLNRVVERLSTAPAPESGTYSAPGIPPVVSPFGPRANFYQMTGEISRPYYFNVATYEGSLFADGGVVLVVVVSLILGIAFGLCRRLCLQRPTIVSAGIMAYVTYLAAFLVYENLVAFYTISVLSDALVILLVLRYCTQGRTSQSA